MAGGLEGIGSDQFLTIGSEVEVRSDEEGFKGAWFRATIVTSPTNSASKKKKRALVEYKSLVTEDGSQQLKEYVDQAYLRPLPPQLDHRNLQEGDVVDADYRDGWWTGVVQKALDDNNCKYSVVFENPLDLIEFERERLRLHQDWVAAQWVRPHKKEVLAADSPPVLEHLSHPQNNSNHLEVSAQLENSCVTENNPELTNSGKNLMEQPSFPRSVKDKKMLARNCSATELGPLKNLKDDKTAEATLSVAEPQLKKIPENKEMIREMATQSRRVRGTRRSRKPVVGHQLFKTESSLGKNIVKTKQEKDGEVESQWLHPLTSKGRRSKSQVNSRFTEAGFICAPPSQKREKEKGKEEHANINSAGKGVQKEGISKKAEVPVTMGLKAKKGKEGSLAENPSQLNEELRMRDQKNTNDRAQEKSTEFKQQPAGGSTNKRKRGRPRKLMVASPQVSEGVKGQNGLGNVPDGKVAKEQMPEEVALHVLRGMDSTDSQDASRRKIADFPGCMTNEPARTCVGASDNVDDDDRPLSMWFGGIQHPASVGESRPYPGSNVREPVEVAKESPAVDAVIGSGADEKGGLPFVKSSPVWKTIEAFEVFKNMPQKPHFRPLCQCKEEYREGSAIGNMITFSSLAEKISKLNFDDPRNVFDSILESLVDLEKYGFNVTILRGRVSALLSIKDRQGLFQVESKDAECNMVEHSDVKTKLVEEADFIAKKIIELQQKQASVQSEMEAKDVEIARLQLHVNAMNEGIQRARSDFEKLALDPLK